MHISTIISSTGRTMRICASKYLDLQEHATFSNAAIIASYALVDDIEIDLQKTRIVRDSGLALLLMLYRRAKLKNSRIKLLNCPKELQNRLFRNNIAGHFQIV